MGPSSGVVWALDKKGKIYVRQGITPEFLIGVAWVPLDSEIQAVQLSIRYCVLCPFLSLTLLYVFFLVLSAKMQYGCCPPVVAFTIVCCEEHPMLVGKRCLVLARHYQVYTLKVLRTVFHDQ